MNIYVHTYKNANSTLLIVVVTVVVVVDVVVVVEVVEVVDVVEVVEVVVVVVVVVVTVVLGMTIKTTSTAAMIPPRRIRASGKRNKQRGEHRQRMRLRHLSETF